MGPCRMPIAAILAVLAVAASFAAAFADTPGARRDNIVVILDASGSMLAKTGGQAKMDIAKKTLLELIEGFPDTAAVGLVAYGHRRKNDCGDVETLVALGPVDKPRLARAVRGLAPLGKTPITDAIRAVADSLKTVPGETCILLVSDGKETCEGDPCAAVARLRESGPRFVLDVVGFDVSPDERRQLECLAEAGGGTYHAARDADQLRRAVGAVAERQSLAAGILQVDAKRNGREIAAHVRILDKETGREVHHHWTTPGEGLKKYLAPGTYVAEVTDDEADGKPLRAVEAVVAAGKTTRETVAFSCAVLRLATTLDGKPSQALVEVYRAGTPERVLAEVTEGSGPAKEIALPGGDYDLVVTSDRTKDRPVARVNGITVADGETRDVPFAFASGWLEVAPVAASGPIAAEVKILAPDSRDLLWFEKAAPGRPARFLLSPGAYVVAIEGKNGESMENPAKDEQVRVEQGRATRLEAAMSPGQP